jgi:hypothetical protein
MSSKLTPSRLGSFFGIGNKQSTKRATAQKEVAFDDADARQQHTPPSDYSALHDAPYLDIPRDAGARGLSPQNARTLPEARRPSSKESRYPQSLYTLTDADPFAATSSIASSPASRPPVRPARSPDRNHLHPRPILIQTQSDPSVPVPSPFGSPIDHDQNASGYGSIICFTWPPCFPSDPPIPGLPTAYCRPMILPLRSVHPQNTCWRTPLNGLRGPPSRVLCTRQTTRALPDSEGTTIDKKV